MQSDAEGFLYPTIDKEICVECGMCERVCPVINRAETRRPLSVYAAKNPDDAIRLKSSSGGIFTLLAEWIIAEEGVVFGARFDKDWNVIHDYTETLDGIAAFRGSKYVQSRIGSAFEEAEKFLKVGRKVLFSGTPGQIAGLKRFLGRMYTGLFTVDIVCHGVPSPLIWNEYLRSVADRSRITDIDMRNKATGWRNYSVRIAKGGGQALVNDLACNNTFMSGFMHNLYLRPSCHVCPVKSGRSQSDITIGDFWKIDDCLPEFNRDDKGVTLLLINTEAGAMLFDGLRVDGVEADYECALVGNPSLIHSTTLTASRSKFWKLYEKRGIGAIPVVCRKLEPSFVKVMMWRLKCGLMKIIKR